MGHTGQLGLQTETNIQQGANSDLPAAAAHKQSHDGEFEPDNWATNGIAAEYGDGGFNANVEGDEPGYNFFLKLLGANDIVLDLGCNYGNFSRAIARQSGHVIGMDVNATAVSKAIENHSDVENLDFIHSRAEDPLPENLVGMCKAVTMTFVDAVIGKPDELFKTFEKIGSALTDGGRLIMFRQNPDGLDEKRDCINYSQPNFGSIAFRYDGQIFEHSITITNESGEQNRIILHDHMWRNAYIQGMLDYLGFDVQFINLSMEMDNEHPEYAEMFREIIEESEARHGIKFRGEFTGRKGREKFQIVVATKRPIVQDVEA